MRALIISAAMLLCVGCAPADASPVDEIVERTRTTEATYAVYSRIHVAPPGAEPFTVWSAEFHSGRLHRVDSEKHRMVADCASGKGTYLNVETGELSSEPWVVAAACGINANKAILEKAHLGEHATPFGRVTRVRLRDEDHVRTYDILWSGAILGSTFVTPPPASKTDVRQEGVAVEQALPTGDIFSRASLARSVVPAKYRR